MTKSSKYERRWGEFEKRLVFAPELAEGIDLMAKLRVRLHIDKLRPEDVGSTVRVAVLDTSQADELHSTVAEATTTVPADSDHIDVVIELPDDALEKRRRYSLWGHVDHEGTGHMASGDLIITQNIPVTLDNIRNGAAAIEAKLTRI